MLFRRLRYTLATVVARRRLDAEIDEELRYHVDAHVDMLVAQGMPEPDARREALRLFGGSTRLRDEVRDAQGMAPVDAVLQHVHFAVRGVRRAPAFSAMVVLTLALGIGANGAMFGIIDQVLLRGPEHVVDPGRLRRAYVTTRNEAGGSSTDDVQSYALMTLLGQHVAAFEGVAGYTHGMPVRVGPGADAPKATVAQATASYFPLLGVHPALGRFYSEAEDRPPIGADVAVLSYDYWKRTLGGDASAIGRRLRLGENLVTVIGVAPRGFTGAERAPVDAWIPMSIRSGWRSDWATTWNSTWMQTIARLRPGVSDAVATEQATAALRARFPKYDRVVGVRTVSMLPIDFDGSGHEPSELGVARLLYGVAMVVLLVAAANVANLLLARGARRRRELAVHLALGAGRARIAGMLLAESALLALCGGVLGVGLAYGAGALIRRTLLPTVAWPAPPVDGSVLAYTLAAVVATTLIIGIAPALYATRGDALVALRASGTRTGERGGATRTVLQVAQVAFSVVLLFAAGLFVISVLRIRALDLGIQPDRVAAANVGFADPAPSSEDVQFAREHARADAIVARLARDPRVAHASASVGTPFFSTMGIGMSVPGWKTLPVAPAGPMPFISAVGPDYFATVGTPLLRGRVFTAADHDGSPHVAIVNQTMARLLWPDDDPLGKCLELQYYDGCTQVVGVVADARRWRLREDAAMQYYVPLGQERGIGGIVLLVRPHGDAESFEPALHDLLRKLAPDATSIDVTTMQELIDPQIRPWRVGATLFGLFGALALIIAGVGLFSVASYLVAQRSHEMGVRIALGARAEQLARLVVGGSLRASVAGVALGTGIALALAPTIQPLLFDTSARDPRLLAVIAGLLVVTTIVAALAPWRRACRVDPITVLRAD